MRTIGPRGLDLVKRFEGCPDGDPSTVNLDPYMDPAGIWTIGWGHAIRFGGRFLRGARDRRVAYDLYPGGITRAQAERLLEADLSDAAAEVDAFTRTVDLGAAAFDALVSFHFNTGALGRSTLLRKLRAGDRDGAADQFLRWTKARVDGRLVVLPGLVRRRAAERILFLAWT